MRRALVALCLALSACSAPIAPAPCLDANMFRGGPMWPLLDGTEECPLPADNPRCVSGEETFCEPVTA